MNRSRNLNQRKNRSLLEVGRHFNKEVGIYYFFQFTILTQFLSFRLRLVRVKVFSENRYFPEMLFSEKENVFMCLVAFQKMFRKIFSDIWLCS